jgi:hypothetical protein
MDTTELLLWTTTSGWLHRFTHPRLRIEPTHQAIRARPFSPLTPGLALHDGHHPNITELHDLAETYIHPALEKSHQRHLFRPDIDRRRRLPRRAPHLRRALEPYAGPMPRPFCRVHTVNRPATTSLVRVPARIAGTNRAERSTSLAMAELIRRKRRSDLGRFDRNGQLLGCWISGTVSLHYVLPRVCQRSLGLRSKEARLEPWLLAT